MRSWLVVADHGPVGRDGHDRQVVGAGELRRLGLGRPGHPGQLLVQAEVVLQGDRGPGVVLLLDLDPLLGLDRLVEAVGPAPALEDAAGELVDDLHLAVGDDVVLVPPVQLLGLAGPGSAGGRSWTRPGRTGCRSRGLARPSRCPPRWGRPSASPRRPRSRRQRVKGPGDPGELVVEPGRLGRGPGDDQRRAGLVDEDGVDLVHDRVVSGPAGTMCSRERAMLSRR